MSNVVFFMRKRIEEEFEDGFEKRSFSIITNKFLNTTVQPHYISEYDVMECNGAIRRYYG